MFLNGTINKNTWRIMVKSKSFRLRLIAIRKIINLDDKMENKYLLTQINYFFYYSSYYYQTKPYYLLCMIRLSCLF